MLDLLARSGISVPARARHAVAAGFLPAMLLSCSNDVLMNLVHLSLTQRFSSLQHFIEGAQSITQLYHVPTETEIDTCRRAYEIAINATSLSPRLVSVLKRFQENGIRLVLVSDVSSFWQPLISKLELERWFEIQLLSCSTGALKRDGRSWRAAIDSMQLKAGSAVLVGDSWRSDGACALNAGTNAILVGGKSRHAANLMLRHFSSLLLVDDIGSVRVTPQARNALNALAAGLSEEVEQDPCKALVVGPSGFIGLSRLAGFTWMPTAHHALQHLLQRHEGEA